MRKFKLEEHISIIEIKNRNLQGAKLIGSDDRAILENLVFTAFFEDLLEMSNCSYKEFEAYYLSKVVRAPKSYNSIDETTLSFMIYSDVGKFISNLSFIDSKIFLSFTKIEWFFLVNIFRSFYIASLRTSRWITSEEQLLDAPPANECLKRARSKNVEMYKMFSTVDSFFEKFFTERSTDSKGIEKTQKEIFNLYHDFLKFSSDLEVNNFFWFDGMRWQRKSTTRLFDWILYVAEEQLFALFKESTGFKTNALVEIISEFRKQVAGSGVEEEAFLQRRKRWKVSVHIKPFKDTLIKNRYRS